MKSTVKTWPCSTVVGRVRMRARALADSSPSTSRRASMFDCGPATCTIWSDMATRPVASPVTPCWIFSSRLVASRIMLVRFVMPACSELTPDWTAATWLLTPPTPLRMLCSEFAIIASSELVSPAASCRENVRPDE